MARPMAYVIAAALALTVAACGGTTIDGDRLEDEIVEDAEAAGLVLDGAECPSPDAEADHRFECTVIVKGEERQLEIVQRNDEGNVGYDLGPLLESSAGSDAGGDEASIRSVIDAVNGDATALCDFASRELRRELERGPGKNCAEAAIARHDQPIEDYEVSVDGDRAAVAGRDSGGERTAALERAPDGSWLVTRLE